ncbi:MAG: hypothetical protein EA378_02915 [Phycisphaerales bacterium]|nr:MAG: hypothetical protein EA378_02915 [Phycisphaerales bacterium]
MERVKAEGKAGAVAFPLGVYPIEPMEPRAGYSVRFEQADGDDDEGEWEEWPDRYVFEIVCPAPRLPALWRTLASLLPPRVYPILDVMGHDAYREIDPYIAYDLVGLEHLIDGTRRYGPFLFEDGLVGFGAMCDEPFAYIFIDEHKIITVRCEPEDKETFEQALAAFDLEAVPEPLGVDAAAHEHRGVLLTPEDRPDLLSAEEIVERLRDLWALTLNIDTETNTDDDGRDLGTTAWRCVVRVRTEEDDLPPGAGEPPGSPDAADGDPDDDDPSPVAPEPPASYRYAEVLLHASSLREAEDLAYEAASDLASRTPPNQAASPNHPSPGPSSTSQPTAAPSKPTPAKPGPAKAGPTKQGPASAPRQGGSPPGAFGEPGAADEFEDDLLGLLEDEAFVVQADRMTPEAFSELLATGGERGARRIRQGVARVVLTRWLN